MLKVEVVRFKQVCNCNNRISFTHEVNLEGAVKYIWTLAPAQTEGDCELHNNISIYSHILLLRADLIDH